jgi:alpha-L-rhamnosidase
MRSCREYYLFTADRSGASALLDFIERNVAGLRQHINTQGLFDIRAWNMFDWADMDTPNEGVVTHQNCLAVHGLRDAAELAAWLDRIDLTQSWLALAADLTAAINTLLWNDERQAYTDCLHGAKHSDVFSQQTQTAAYASGVATGQRSERCRQIMHNPPDGFVRSGSPFFEFFLLEAYQLEGKVQALLDTIRRDWGFMIDMGATTFWEMWSWQQKVGRLTRSHCHGWSAAPTFFLSAYTLGVRPGGPGFAPVVVEPHPGDLAWCRGVMPTPRGNIAVQWDNRPGEPFDLRIQAPDGVDVQIVMPRPGRATLNGLEASSV